MNLFNVFAVDCDDIDCPGESLGAANAMTEDCNDVVLSEVNSVILVNPVTGTDVTNWGNTLADTDFDIDNTDATDVAQKRFFGVGSLNEPETLKKRVNSFQDVKINGTYSLTFNIFTIGSLTYDYWRKVECGIVKPKLYYTTMGGRIFGNDGGILCSDIQVSFLLPEGEDGVESIQVVFTWKSKTSPDRYTNPLP